MSLIRTWTAAATLADFPAKLDWERDICLSPAAAPPTPPRCNTRVRPKGAFLGLSVLHQALHPTLINVAPHPTGRDLLLGILMLELLCARFPWLLPWAWVL